MAQTRRINAAELDFDQIKTNLVSHMKANNATFNDYNYEGSAMNTIIDVLSYITHINSVNANFALNETFLDTAQLRQSVVSHGKLLGYTPRSTSPSIAYVDVAMVNPSNVTDGDGNYLPLTMAKHTTFSTTINSVTYPMYVSDSITINPDASNDYKFSNVKINQGTIKTASYTYADNTFEQYLIHDLYVDTNSIKVDVYESVSSSSFETYTLSTNIVNIDADTKCYFLEETREGKYEIKFGDGIIGKKPSAGNVLKIEYADVGATTVNGATLFALTGSIGGNTNVTLTLVTKASGGASAETKDSIKFNAPLGFVSQNRAVTPDDYKAIIQNTYGNVDTLTVWGGEDNVPPDYGKVYISIKPLSGETLTDIEKTTIINSYLKPKNVVSITPVLVDPDYTYIDLEVYFKFNPNVASVTVGGLQDSVRTTLTSYDSDTLKKFGGIFRSSNVAKLVDDTNVAILSNIMRVKFHKKFTPVIGTETRYQLDFNQELAKQDTYHIESTSFVYNGYQCTLKDVYDTIKAKYLIQIVDTTGTVRNSNVGYVENLTGRVVLEGFNLTSIVDTSTTKLKIMAKPASSDIKPTRNELLTIDYGNATITGEIDTMAVGGTTAGIDYTTVSNN